MLTHPLPQPAPTSSASPFPRDHLSIIVLSAHTHPMTAKNTPPHLAQPTLRRLAPPLHHHRIALHAPRNVVPCVRHGVEFFLECPCVLYTSRAGAVVASAAVGARDRRCTCVDVVGVVLTDCGEFVLGKGEAGAEACYLNAG